MENVYKIQLTPSGSTSVAPLFRAVQGDKSSRKIEASIYNDDGTVFQNESEITATYTSKKPDGNGTTHSATISASASEFKVIVTLTEQDLACDGKVYATIVLKKSAAILAAMPFYFWVAPIPMGSDVESTSDYQTMQEATAATEQATADAIEATEAAEQAIEYATEAADTASNYNIDLLAEGYDATAIYVTGDYCNYQGALYRCITDIVTPEAWTASHWVAVELGADVQDAWRDATEGYSDTLTAGDLTSDEYQTDDEPYLYRRTFNGACNHEMDTLVGGTVAWNQLMQNGNFADTSVWAGNESTTTLAVENNVGTLTALSDGDRCKGNKFTSITVTGHKYLFSIDARATVEPSSRMLLVSFFYGTTSSRKPYYTTDTLWHNYSNILECQDTQYSQLRIEVPLASIPTQFRNAQVFDLTQMFGSTIADAIYAMEQAESGSGVAWFRRYFPESYYAYDSGTLKSVEAVAHRMVGKNLLDTAVYSNIGTSVKYKPIYVGEGTFTMSTTAPQNSNSNANLFFLSGSVNTGAVTRVNGVWSGTTRTVTSENGYVTIGYCSRDGVDPNFYDTQIEYGSTATTYKPFAQHTYKLSDIILRGIPKLTDGKLTYDGDTYEPSGQVVRRYGVVTPTACLSSYARTNGDRVGIIARNGYVINNNTISNTKCNILPTVGANAQYASNYSSVSINDTGNVLICIAGITTHADLNAWLASHNVSVIYELATPTTETASPYEPAQVVYADGTEEYISQNIVPVGHSTKYPVSIKKALTQIAKAPSANGTYILKCVVSGGVASYSWVTE